MEKNNYNSLEAFSKKPSVLTVSELNPQGKEGKLPIIFTKKIKENLKVIPLNVTRNTSGQTKHFPAATREWFNSVYAYNANSVKNLPIADKTLNKLMKSYFNLYFSKTILKSKRTALRFKRLDLRKIFVSKAEIKHTNSKVIITLYVYNEERRLLNREIKLLRMNLYPSLSALQTMNNSKREGSMDFFIHKEFFLLNNRKLSLLLKKIEIKLSRLSLDSISEGNLDYNNLSPEIKASLYKDIARVYLEEELMTIARYKLLLNLNKSKFDGDFISKIKPLVRGLYNKEVEFNIVNLKTLYFNSDIFTQAISTKIRNRNNKLLRVLNSSLQLVKLPDLNNNIGKYGKDSFFSDEQLWLNKVKNLKVNDFISDPVAATATTTSSLFLEEKLGQEKLGRVVSLSKGNEDILDKLLLNIFPLKFPGTKASLLNPLAAAKENPSVAQEGVREDNEKKNLILDSLKYKSMAGVRLEAKGRLTKRFTASRSVFKMRWKGNLKNIDSSYRGLSSVLLRGHVKPNVQYSVVNSKTRNGSFGLKGWIGHK